MLLSGHDRPSARVPLTVPFDRRSQGWMSDSMSRSSDRLRSPGEAPRQARPTTPGDHHAEVPAPQASDGEPERPRPATEHELGELRLGLSVQRDLLALKTAMASDEVVRDRAPGPQKEL